MLLQQSMVFCFVCSVLPGTVCVCAVLYSARCCSCRSGAVHRLQACSLARSPAARQRRVLLLLPLLLLAMLLPEKMQ